jgi:hypothetical protein
MERELAEDTDVPRVPDDVLVRAVRVGPTAIGVDSSREYGTNHRPERFFNGRQSMIVPVPLGAPIPPSVLSETAGDPAPETKAMRPDSQTIARAVKTFDAQTSDSWQRLPDHKALEISGIDVDAASFAITGDRFDGRARLLVKKPRKLITGKDAFETRVHSVFVRGHLNGAGPVVDEFRIDELSEMERRFGQGAS